jgi:hypothetical protein
MIAAARLSSKAIGVRMRDEPPCVAQSHAILCEKWLQLLVVQELIHIANLVKKKP